MPSFQQTRDLYRMQRQAKKIKKELRNIHVEAEADGVKVVVNGEQEIIEIVIGGDVARERIPAFLKDALNRAMKKAQVVAAEKMQPVMGAMGMPIGEQGMRGLGA